MKVRYRKTYYAVSLLIGDIFMILFALRASFWLRFESHWIELASGVPEYSAYSHTFGLVVIVTIVLYRFYGLYQEEKISSLFDECALVIRATSATLILLLGVTFFYRGFSFSRSYLLVVWVMMPLCTGVIRSILAYAYMFYRRSNNKFKEVLLIGANHESIRYALKVLREPRLCTKVVGLLDSSSSKASKYKLLPVLGSEHDLEKVLSRNENINEVVVTEPNLKHSQIMKIMIICDKYLVSFKWRPDIMGLITTQMNVRYEMGLPLLSVKESPLMEWENRLIKRISDIVLSFMALVVLAPFFIIMAILIRLDSAGPIFYRQERVGEDGRSFDLFKFRTMRPGAEDKTGPIWARENDDRRTRLGSFMRKTNIDEFPQFWNVLKGDMSLVGPRPERPHFVGQFKEGIPRYMGRHQIKSGITGWAQVHGLRGNTSIEMRTQYDLYYIENWSVFLDIHILFRTVFAFKNAY